MSPGVARRQVLLRRLASRPNQSRLKLDRSWLPDFPVLQVPANEPRRQPTVEPLLAQHLPPSQRQAGLLEHEHPARPGLQIALADCREFLAVSTDLRDIRPTKAEVLLPAQAPDRR